VSFNEITFLILRVATSRGLLSLECSFGFPPLITLRSLLWILTCSINGTNRYANEFNKMIEDFFKNPYRNLKSMKVCTKTY